MDSRDYEYQMGFRGKAWTVEMIFSFFSTEELHDGLSKLSA